MRIIPAVDIKSGKCVRLTQGRADQETVYSDDPLAMVQFWEEQNAGLIHVVDLDGAFEGTTANADLIRKIIHTSSADIQVGGGIRSHSAAELYLNAGASRIILGTIAQKDPAFVRESCRLFPGKILVGIDARDGFVAVKGWTELAKQKAVDLAVQLQDVGVAGFIFTDISRDGTLQGPNLDSVREFASATRLPVIASGGVSRAEDITRLAALRPAVAGVIVGKALYDKTLDYKEAVRLAASAHAG